jgi:hypothetical protein
LLKLFLLLLVRATAKLKLSKKTQKKAEKDENTHTRKTKSHSLSAIINCSSLHPRKKIDTFLFVCLLVGNRRI